MAKKFGALTDYFDLAGDTLTLVNSTKTPRALTAERVASKCEYVAEATHGQTSAGTLAEVSCTYEVVAGGTFSASSLVLGVNDTIIVTSIEIESAEGTLPTVTVSGLINIGDIADAPTGKAASVTLPAVSVKGSICAQELGATLTAGALSSTTLSYAIQVEDIADGTGVIIAHGLHLPISTITASLVAVGETEISWAPPSGYTLLQALGSDQPQASWHTATATAEKMLTLNTAQP